MAKELPMPAQAPLTALIQGFGAWAMPNRMGLYSSLSWASTLKSLPASGTSWRSAPALKARPLPVSTTTRTPSSAFTCSTAARSSPRRAALKLLSASGRLRLTRATEPRSSIVTVSSLTLYLPGARSQAMAPDSLSPAISCSAKPMAARTSSVSCPVSCPPWRTSPGVRLKRGAGAGWVMPSTSM